MSVLTVRAASGRPARPAAPASSRSCKPTLLLLLARPALGCRAPPPAGATLRPTTAPDGPDTRVTLHAGPHLKLNARLAPALETTGGTVLRFASGRLTSDSAYFAEPPSALLPGRHDDVHGTLHVSVCQDDQLVCRSVTVEL